MTDFAEFHADGADRTGSICAFERHQNHEKRRDFLIVGRPLLNDTKIMKTGAIQKKGKLWSIKKTNAAGSQQ